MYCPNCGGQLQLIPKQPFPYNDEWYELPDKEREEYLQNQANYERNEREEYECLGRKCFQKDYPLYFHHPFGGIESAPGDSWSLSWVK